MNGCYKVKQIQVEKKKDKTLWTSQFERPHSQISKNTYTHRRIQTHIHRHICVHIEVRQDK